MCEILSLFIFRYNSGALKISLKHHGDFIPKVLCNDSKSRIIVVIYRGYFRADCYSTVIAGLCLNCVLRNDQQTQRSTILPHPSSAARSTKPNFHIHQNIVTSFQQNRKPTSFVGRYIPAKHGEHALFSQTQIQSSPKRRSPFILRGRNGPSVL